MAKGIWIGTGAVIITLLLLMSSAPGVTGFTPTTGLDASETSISDSKWSAEAGHSDSYGPYLRDVSWVPPRTASTQYLGMLSVPWVKIDGTTYNLDATRYYSGTYVSNPQNQDWEVVTEYYWTVGTSPTYDFWVEVKYILNGGTGLIDCDVYVSVYQQGGGPDVVFDLEVPWRVDFDISGASNDDSYLYIDGGDNPDYWDQEGNETERDYSSPVDPTYSADVKQEDSSSSSRIGLIEAVSPSTDDDFNWYLLKYASGEHLGDPTNYVTGTTTSIDGQDNVIWAVGGRDNTYTVNSAATVEIDILLV